jgi:uncharacterized coiled-coil DUF342 family protein
MQVLNKIDEALTILNDIDEYDSTLNGKLSELDSKEQDLLHYIENNKISILWCYKMIKEIKTIRQERRRVKNDMDLLSKFNELKSKISSKDNRQFILPELHKKEKQLSTIYKNRQYTEEDMNKIVGLGK